MAKHLLHAAFALFVSSTALGAAGSPTGITFYKDVLPILQEHCQTCHRPGEVAPMSLLSFSDARPWARAIREAVLTKKMPPWFADPHYGSFYNDRTLPQRDIDTLVAWADHGSPEGNAQDAPKPLSFPTGGWRLGKPDVVVEMEKEFQIPASGDVDYQYFSVPTHFNKDTWIQASEAQPGNRAAVHHIIVYVREPGAPDIEKDERSPADRQNPKDPPVDDGTAGFLGSHAAGQELAGVYVPGGDPLVLQPGQARLIKAGSDLVFQMHYTPTGKPESDRSRIGLYFAKEPPTARAGWFAMADLNMKIPAREPSYPVRSSLTLKHDVTLVSVMPHMHLRGKSFELRATYPSGTEETLLSVPRYNFNWQTVYYLKPIRLLPKGTRLDLTCVYDNSANNPVNPNPNVPVYWGGQTWEEMDIAFVDLVMPPGLTPHELAASVNPPEPPKADDPKRTQTPYPPASGPAGSRPGAPQSP